MARGPRRRSVSASGRPVRENGRARYRMITVYTAGQSATGGAVSQQPAGGAAPVVIPADGLPIPREYVELCTSEEMAAKCVARLVAGRLAFVHQSGDLLMFGSRGWQPVHRTAVEEACAEFAHWNIGSEDKESKLIKMSPRTTGRKSVGRAITQLLEPMIGTEFADWDTAPNMIMLPDGVLLDVFTGARRQSEPADRIRRRVSVAPASESDYKPVRVSSRDRIRHSRRGRTRLSTAATRCRPGR